MIYKTLNKLEVEELNNELKHQLPGSSKIFYVIRNFLNDLLPGMEVIVDSWPDWSSIVIRTCSEEEAQPFFRDTYICHSRSSSSLKYFLQRPDVVNWRKPATFTGVPRDVAPVISAMCNKHMGRIAWMEPRFMYAWSKQGLPHKPKVPDGLTLGVLTLDDAQTLRQDWEGSRYRDDMEGYFRTVIKNFESSCLRDSKGYLQAYACMQFNGSIAMLYVKPEHRDEDYFKVVLSDLACRRLKQGEVAYGFIPANDSDLVDQMRDMEFVWVPHGDMVWLKYQPLQINMSESMKLPPTSCLTGAADDKSQELLDCVCSNMARFSKTFDICRHEYIGSSHFQKAVLKGTTALTSLHDRSTVLATTS